MGWLSAGSAHRRLEVRWQFCNEPSLWSYAVETVVDSIGGVCRYLK
jgi:hypothetical protein